MRLVVLRRGRALHSFTTSPARARRDITKYSQGEDKGRDLTHWGMDELGWMLARRNRHWEELLASRRLPAWLATWVTFCKGLAPPATPNYRYLHGLIAVGEVEAAAAAAVAEQAKRAAQAAAGCVQEVEE